MCTQTKGQQTGPGRGPGHCHGSTRQMSCGAKQQQQQQQESEHMGFSTSWEEPCVCLCVCVWPLSSCYRRSTSLLFQSDSQIISCYFKLYWKVTNESNHSDFSGSLTTKLNEKQKSLDPSKYRLHAHKSISTCSKKTQHIYIYICVFNKDTHTHAAHTRASPWKPDL